MKKILVINGVNINLIGERESAVYGQESIEDINAQIVSYAEKKDLKCEIFHSNIEGEIVNKIHSSRNDFDGVIINAGAYTHYSLAIRDAIAAVQMPFVEVHFSNIFARESFRHDTVLSAVCIGHISGFGKCSYFLAVDALKYNFR